MSSRSIPRLLLAMAAIGVLSAFTATSAFAVSGTTGNATGVDTTAATLHGTVNQGGQETVWWFAYKLSSSERFEHATPITPAEDIEEGGLSVAEVADKHLQPETAYSFVLIVADLVTSEYDIGEEQSFTTLDYHPPLFAAAEYPAAIAGSNDVSSAFELENSQGQTLQMKCETVDLDGSLSSSSNALSVAPTVDKCKFAGFNATVTPNSCSYVFNVDSSGPPYTGDLGISCSEEGDGIEFVAALGCTIKVAPQTASGSFAYETQGSGTGRTVHATGSATAVKWTATPTCEFFGISGSGENGVMPVSATMEALGEEGSEELYVSGGEEAVGAFMAGSETGEEGAPRIEAGQYPALIAGSNAASSKFELENNEGKTLQMKCETVDLDGSLSSSSNALSVAPTVDKCKFADINATVTPNSCSYVFNVDSSGPPYTGDLGISCSEEGDGIEFVAALGCTIKVAPQSPSGSLEYETQGSGTGRTVQATGSATAVKWTATPQCEFFGLSGSGENGVMPVSASLGGYQPV